MTTDVLDIVTGYVDRALQRLAAEDRMVAGSKHIPPDMRDTTGLELPDCVGWKAIDSTVSDAELDELEHAIKLQYPPSYRLFLQYKYFVGLTEVGVRFCPHVSDRWHDVLLAFYHGRDAQGGSLKKVYKQWDAEQAIVGGYLPFGFETTRAGISPVCFDTTRRDAAGDCPVVFWGHEVLGAGSGPLLLFSSATAMFRCLTVAAEADVDFITIDGFEDDAMMTKKRSLMERFLACDPQGAGGEAKARWTAWLDL